jgi:hypothetical protein
LALIQSIKIESIKIEMPSQYWSEHPMPSSDFR